MRPPPLAGVIGWPVGHSRSPALHGHWLKRYDLPGWYVAMAVAPETAEQALRALPALGFAGANVTLPHKELALRVADEATPLARRIGAANTLVVRDGAIHADNTDAFGFLENLRQGAPDWRAAAGPADR
jgi:shikimate dehydrogenase